MLDFSGEPTGLSYDSGSGRLFISDDATRRITSITAGGDNTFGTGDDVFVNRFSTRTFGSQDPEDIAYNPNTGNLFIADGQDRRIYEVDSNGNLITSFSTVGFGLSDPEGISFDSDSGNLLIVGEPVNTVFEVSTSGTLIQTIDISSANPVQPAGIEIAPTSDNSSTRSIYIVDRGIDESVDINENDGRLYEFALDGSEPPTGGDGNSFYATFRDTVTLDGNNFNDEDIAFYDGDDGTWTLYVDGSDLGLGNREIDAIHVSDDGSVLLSLNQDGSVNGLGFIDDADILRFVPSSTGENTTGSFELYFDGSDVGLSDGAEDIDGVAIAGNGDILISTNGSYNVDGLSGNDEDILAFTPSSLGANTAGSFALYVDGSDVGLNDDSNEDIKGISLQDNGDLVFSSLGNFQVSGASGGGNDLFAFDPSSLGDNTSGSFSIFSAGADNGLGNQIVADISVV